MTESAVGRVSLYITHKDWRKLMDGNPLEVHFEDNFYLTINLTQKLPKDTRPRGAASGQLI